MAACSSLTGSGGAGAELCSLGTATGPKGTAWSWDGGGSGTQKGRERYTKQKQQHDGNQAIILQGIIVTVI